MVVTPPYLRPHRGPRPVIATRWWSPLHICDRIVVTPYIHDQIAITPNFVCHQIAASPIFATEWRSLFPHLRPNGGHPPNGGHMSIAPPWTLTKSQKILWGSRYAFGAIQRSPRGSTAPTGVHCSPVEPLHNPVNVAEVGKSLESDLKAPGMAPKAPRDSNNILEDFAVVQFRIDGVAVVQL